MSTSASRLYNFVDDKNAATPITASRVDGEFDAIITKLNQKVIIASSAPSGPIAGMLWLDSTNKILKQYRNAEWVVMGVVHVGTAAPTTKQEGDIWWDSTNDKLYVYTSTTVSQQLLTTAGFGSKGTLIVSQDTGSAPISLAYGTLGQYLKSNGIGSAPEFTGVFPLLGAWVDTYGVGTVYQATTDVLVIGIGNPNAQILYGYTGATSNPATVRAQMYSDTAQGRTIFFPCNKNQYWKVLQCNIAIYTIPIGV